MVAKLTIEMCSGSVPDRNVSHVCNSSNMFRAGGDS